MLPVFLLLIFPGVVLLLPSDGSQVNSFVVHLLVFVHNEKVEVLREKYISILLVFIILIAKAIFV